MIVFTNLQFKGLQTIAVISETLIVQLLVFKLHFTTETKNVKLSYQQ